MSVLRVKESFALLSDPSGRVYAAGHLVDSSDPVVKGRAHLFEPVEAAAARQAPTDLTPEPVAPPAPVEQATAAPGEKRSLFGPKPSAPPAPPQPPAAPETEKA